MPFKRPTLTELSDTIFTDAVGRMRSETPILRRSLIGVLCRVVAAAVHGLYGYLDYMWRQMFVHLCDDEYLDFHGALRGIGRKAGAYASGMVNGRGVDGQWLRAGTKLYFRDDRTRLYTVDNDVLCQNGTLSPTITALEQGYHGNLPAGTVVVLLNPQNGIQSAFEVGSEGVIGGVPPESNFSYRDRILDYIRNPPHGGNRNDYRQWAREVAGIDRAWVIDNYAGLGTVGLMVARSADEQDPIPDAAVMQRLRDHIEEVRPVTADVWIFTPQLQKINFAMKLSPDTEATRNAVLAELRDFLVRDGAPSSYIRFSRISEAISAAVGEHHHELLVPATDILVGKTELPVLGDASFVSSLSRAW